MKKILSFTILAALTVGIANAQSAKKPAATPAMTCAVMSQNKVDIAKSTANHMYADYKGRRYFFCCGGCPAEFKKDPAKFAKTAKSIAIPKVEAKKK